jgi:hypothetical protein
LYFPRLQVATLKDQLSQEMRKRQQYISRSVRTGDEIHDIRSMLDHSLSKVGTATASGASGLSLMI